MSTKEPESAGGAELAVVDHALDPSMGSRNLSVRRLDDSRKPDPRVVAELEDILEQAKRGNVRGFALAAHWQGPGEPYSTLVRKAGTVNTGALVVALERIKLRLIGFVEDIDVDLEGLI